MQALEVFLSSDGDQKRSALGPNRIFLFLRFGNWYQNHRPIWISWLLKGNWTRLL